MALTPEAVEEVSEPGDRSVPGDSSEPVDRVEETPPPVARPAPVAALGAAPGPIEPGDSFALAGRKAMWPHVDRMLSRDAVIRDPTETDALRKYRVATRRLRAAIRVFRDAYPPRELKSIRGGLGELADALGIVRDLDVRIADLDRWGADGDGRAEGLAPLRDAWTQERARAAAELDRRLDAKRHGRLLNSLVAFVSALEARPALAAAPERTVRDRAASSVWEAYERLRAFASVVRWADLETLHAMRIETKRVRYTLEFLAPVLGPEREWLVARLVAAQDHLGGLNDAAVTGAAIRAFLEARHPTLDPAERSAIAAYLAERERDLGRLRRSVGRAWRPVVGVTFAHRLGRAVVIRPVG